jgi:hypothetical protein
MAETGPQHWRVMWSPQSRPTATVWAMTCSGGLRMGPEWVTRRATSRRWELTDVVGWSGGGDSVQRGSGALVNLGGRRRALQLWGDE